MSKPNHVDWRKEYPFDSHYFALEPGLRMHYVDEGSRETNAPSVLMVHGNPTWSFYYRSLISHCRATCRAVAIDHIGCGLSDKPQSYPYSLATHTNNLVKLIDELDLKRIVLVVHDWGGAIGLGAAIKQLARIDRILVLNTAAFPPPYVPWRIAACRIPWLGSAAIRYLNLFAWSATFMAVHKKPLSSSAKAGLLAPYDTPSHRIAIDRFVQDIPLSKQHETWQTLHELENNLPKLAKVPIRFVWGMKDWCFKPQCMYRMQQYWPTSQRTELADIGHYVMEEAPQAVSREWDLLMKQV